MTRTLATKVALVTGASSGIGAATARELARRGAHVVLAARRSDKLEAQAALISRGGGRALAVQADLTDPGQVSRLAERARETYGPVDVLVNNAGVNWATPLAQTTAQEMLGALQVNLLAAMQLTAAVLPDMMSRRQGTIISVASVAGRVAIEPLYSAAKFGVRGFSLGLRRQLAGSGIAVCLVTPGNIRTAMTSGMPEVMPGPELVANTVAALVLRPRREVVVPRKYRGVIWLDELLPEIADLAFRWRHRHDGGEAGYGILPAYARPDGSMT